MAEGHAGAEAVPAARRDLWRRRLTDPAWLLLPQRLFLGVTFTKAGIDKLDSRAFFDPSDPTSMAAQIAAFRATSPIRPLLSVAADHPTAVGVLMALGEIAVGLATLLGVRVRAAAAGGALISLSLLLTVTWRTRPYYYGSDIVFLFCWLPLIAYGSGPLSVQHWAERRWPASNAEPWGSRRALLTQFGGAAAVIALAGLGARLARPGAPRTPAAAGGAARGGAAPGGSAPGGSAPGGSVPGGSAQGGSVPGGSAQGGAEPPLASVSEVPVGGVLPITAPGNVDAYLVRLADRRFVAFDRTCTHGGCQVGVSADRKSFVCPCHGGQYDARTGAVVAGPPPRPLDRVPVRVSGDEVVAGGQ
jgi:thiosulfate dehydrogenase (quinone) large subunit